MSEIIKERTPYEIELFCVFMDYYITEADAWQAVKLAIENNLTAHEVMKIF